MNPNIQSGSDQVEQDVIRWRHHFHQNPELSNREFKTAKKVADMLSKFGLEVTTGIAHTGVVGILKGGKPGPVVALRADMDALPVEEKTGLPFASTVRTQYLDQEVGVMHACGHDAHIAILLGAAKVLADMREQIPGTVKFIFQPAEEGAPPGEEGGAKLMIKEGVLEGDYRPEAIFALHVWPGETGGIKYREKGAMAASDRLKIVVRGKQTHGSSPWAGVDPIIVSAQIMSALQLIPSRQLNITKAPSVITIGSIHGGVRGNIIPDEVTMMGTIRTFDMEVRKELLSRLRKTAVAIAESAGATAEVSIDPYAPVTYNDPALTAKMLPSLEKAVGKENIAESPLVMGAEDFSYFQEKIPGLYVFLGVKKEGVSVEQSASNHSPYFYVNDRALKNGVRTLSTLALDYLTEAQ
ncbi:MAG: amidohydrolase [Pseudomonadales bacterium]|nr:amidohydrolase [Pseudomonadales bacterium]